MKADSNSRSKFPPFFLKIVHSDVYMVLCLGTREPCLLRSCYYNNVPDAVAMIIIHGVALPLVYRKAPK